MMTAKTITVNGATYTLYTITKSGTQTVDGKAKNAVIWSCGGGSGGVSTSGGAGAYCAETSALTLSGSQVVSIGAAGGNSSVSNNGTSLLAANGVNGSKNGGSGGGPSGTGDGIAKYPFSDSANFKRHCAGGGGGYYIYYDVLSESNNKRYGLGLGGSNGGNGGNKNGTTGGDYGGGNGGSATSNSETTSAQNGRAASFYGSGGGGGGHADSLQLSSKTGSGGAGYQGVVYIRVPGKQKTTTI